MAEPYGLPIDIAWLFLLALIIRMQENFRPIIESDECSHLLGKIGRAESKEAKLSTIQFSGEIYILIKLYFIRDFSLILKARQHSKESARI